MATRGTLYRCHLCSFLFGGDGVQTEGIESAWTQDLEAIGERKLLSGERVELFVTIANCPFPITEETAIRFDILEEDFLLTGGADDRVGSLLCGNAKPSDEEFPVLGYREIKAWTLPISQTVAEAVADFMSEHPLDYREYLLVLRDPATNETYHLTTWWRASSVDDAAGASEFYFIMNVANEDANEFEDESEPILTVSREPAPADAPSVSHEELDAPAEALLSGSTFMLDFDIDVPESDLEDVESTREGTLAFQKEAGRLYALAVARSTSSGASGGDGADTTVGDADDAASDFIFPPTVPSGAAGGPKTTAGAPPPPGAGLPQLPPDGGLPDPVVPWSYLHPEDYLDRQHVANAVGVDKPINGRSPFDGKLIARLQPGIDVQIKSPVARYYEAYEFGRAVNWGQLQFGHGNFTILEGPIYFAEGEPVVDEHRPRYYVLPLEETIEEGKVTRLGSDESGHARMIPNEFPVRQFHFIRFDEHSGGYAAQRVFSVQVQTPSGPNGQLYSTFQSPFYDEARRQTERLRPFNPDDPLDPVGGTFAATAFADIDAAYLGGNVDLAVALLGSMSRSGFARANPAQRLDYASFLSAHLPELPDLPWQTGTGSVLHALTELIAAAAERGTLEGLQEVAAIRALLDQPPDIPIAERRANRFIRLMNSELWDLLELIGRKCLPLEPALAQKTGIQLQPFTIRSLFGLFLKQLGVNTTNDALLFLARLSWSPGGLTLGTDAVAEVSTALHSLLRFLADFIGGLIHLVLHPVELLKAIGMLLELIAKAIFAVIPLPAKLSAADLVDVVLPFLATQNDLLVVAPITREDAIALVRKYAPALDKHDPILDKMYEMVKQFQDQVLTEFKAIADQVSQKVNHVFAGAQQFRVMDEVLLQIKWRAIWEIASLFVGAGELKALASGSKALLVSAVGLLRVGEAGNVLLKAQEVEKILLLARLLSKESKAADAAGFARALSYLPDQELKDLAPAMAAMEHIEEAQSVQHLAQLNAASPAAGKVTSAANKAEALVLLERKFGGTLPESATKALETLASEGRLTPAQLKEICQVLPDSEAERFFQAVNNLRGKGLHGLAEFTPEFYLGIAQSPRSLAMFERGEADLLNRLTTLTSDAKIDWETTERYVAAYENEVTRLGKSGDGAALRKLAEDVDKRNLQQIKTLAGDVTKPPTIRPAPTPAPKTFGPFSPGHAEVRDLFGGLERSVLDELFPRANAPLTDDIFTRLLLPGERTSIEKLASLNKARLRRLVTELRGPTYNARKATLLKQVKRLQNGEKEAEELSKALDKLNNAFVKSVEHDLAKANITTERIASEISEEGLRDAVNVRVKEMQQRIKDFKDKAARVDDELAKATTDAQKKLLSKARTDAETGAASIESDMADLTRWRDDAQGRTKDLADLRDVIGNSTMLKDRLRNGGNSGLHRLLCDMLFNQKVAKGKALKTVAGDFERFVAGRMSHFRGYSGEMDLAFRLGDRVDLVILKAPDSFVTRTGTDLVVAQRYIDDETKLERLRVLVFDNKSTRKLTEDKVSALLKNLADNLADDARQFNQLAAAGGEEAIAFRRSAQQIEAASKELADVIKRSRSVTNQTTQDKMARILTKYDIQLVVTNEGGQTTGIAERLKKTISFWNPAESKLPPVPVKRVLKKVVNP